MAGTGTKPLATGKQTTKYGQKVTRAPLQLAVNPVLAYENQHYEILADHFIGNGGEADVFLACCRETNDRVAAKIYNESSPSADANRKVTFDFIKAHSDYHEYHLMPILAYGYVRVRLVVPDREYELPVEIMPYCPNSGIIKADFQTLSNKVIPQINTALHTMHEANLLHRDVKPDNIYLYDGEYVLSDFGTCTSIESINENVSLRLTSQKRGTVGYTAPEVWGGIAEKASDYFAFGCTIATLYLGHHPYESMLKEKDAAEKINATIRTIGLQMNCTQEDSNLQDLVNALTTLDPGQRIGYDKVKQWLVDPNEFHNQYRSNFSPKEEPFTFKFDGEVCYSERALTEAMARNWKYAEGCLYRGHNNVFITFYINHNDQDKANHLSGIVEDYPTATNRALGVARALHYIYPQGPFYWSGLSFNKLRDVRSLVDSGRLSEEEIIQMLQSKYLSWKISQQNPNHSAVAAVSRCEEAAANFPKFGYHMFMNSVSVKKTGTDVQAQIDVHFAKCAKDPITLNSFEGPAASDEWLAYLASYDQYYEETLKLKRNLTSGKPQLEDIFEFYEAISRNKDEVRRTYINWGPHSYIYWVIQNLNMYSSHTQDARDKKALLQSARFTNNMTIKELHQRFFEMEQNMIDFRSYFQNNMLVGFLGIENDLNPAGITTNNIDGYFNAEFCGHKVPIGYIRYLQTSAEHN